MSIRASKMAENGSKSNNERGKLAIDTPSALASINYNSIIASDKGTSSEDEAPEAQAIPADDARTAIGVSISREQTRLTSPTTPASEKAAAIERAGGFFGGLGGTDGALVEEPEEEEEDVADIRKWDNDAVTSDAEKEQAYESRPAPPSKQQVPERAARKTEVRLPTPWRVDQTGHWQTGTKARSGLLDGIFNRRRASSGPESTQEGWQKSLLSSLPSLPKNFSLSSPFSSSHDTRYDSTGDVHTSSKTSSPPLSRYAGESESSSSTAIRRQRSKSHGRLTLSSQRNLEEQEGGDIATGEMMRQRTAHSAQNRAGLLRRSTSEQSLGTQRTLSTVNSLGDDSRFENVQGQVNNRFKAIKDSWQDSSIKLPSLSSFTPDFMRDRAGSVHKRSSLKQPPGDVNARPIRDLDSTARPIDPMTEQYASSKAAIGDTTSSKATSHPRFTQALEHLEGDVVILGGYRGSILRSADPPHRQLWVPVKVGLNLRKVNLEVGIEEGDDERATEKVIPGGMLTHIGPVDIARRLFKRLRSCKNARNGKLRVHDYGYDWRLDPNYLSEGLVKFLETLPCNKPGMSKQSRGAIVIAHSLGGLITRHAVNQRPDLFGGVIYAGVPKTCVNILGPMRNGDEVLLSNRVLTAQVNFTIRTSFALLPLDGRCFFDKNTRKEYRVDFFDPQTWVDFRLSPCVSRALPPLHAPLKSTSITGYVNSMASVLPGLPGRGRKSSLRSKSPADLSKATTAGGAAEPDMAAMDTMDSRPGTVNDGDDDENNDSGTSARTNVTIPREKSLEYLTRTLASVKKFKQDLSFNPEHGASNAYPPVAVIYGKSTPTVFGAKVDGLEGIKHADAYDELAFASGDGVVLAKAAMLPQGYSTVRGGVVSSERGHVTLLSDLEAIGKCLDAVMKARKKGVGLGR